MRCARLWRSGASGHELFGASCSPGTSSRQARRSSPGATHDRGARSKLKSLRTSFPYYQSKGASDAASSRSAHSGVRLARKRSLLLHLKAWAQATLTRPSHPAVASIARTPRNENSKTPARSGAMAPLDLAGHPKPTASSYYSPRFHHHLLPSADLLPVGLDLDRSSRCDPTRGACTINRGLTGASIEATVTVERGESVVRERGQISHKKRC